ncbi:sensor domain-containing diguanylate cyclase [Belnapia rosea]|uniref:diguanylate cyclase n=1 Tax=Belnapia rosea TaxID=938405 RepID=A0A1G6SU79_9PROT|nr:diguanylate cyclase [Belnapia rosea]SDD20490.1 diguanylate cyclase (GGDEF) domain-containing protein [Belnapia rosea]
MSLAGWFGPGWRHGLTVGVLCALLGVAGSAMVIRAERGRLIADAGQRLADYARVMALRLDSGLADWAHDVGMLARFEVFERQPAQPSMARRLLEDLKGRSPTFSWIGFTGTDGKVIAATGGLLEGADVSARPWFRPGLAGPHLGDVHPAVMLAKLLPEDQGGGADAYFVDAAAPVHAADGAVIGVIAGHLTWRWAEGVRRELAVFAPWQPPPILRVIGTDKLVLLGPENERGKPWPQERSAGGWRETTLPGHPPAILGFARAEGAPDRPTLDWVVVAQRDRVAVLAPLWSFGLWLGFGTFGIAATGGALAGWYAGRVGSTIQRVLGGSAGRDVARQLEQLRDQAWRDPLTGLLNRAGFAAWQKALPPLDEGCAVVALDLDGFKPINDTHGHAAGDAVLRGIGAWLQGNLRDEDAAVRLGGDEFLLCLIGPSAKVEAAAREVGARLNAMLRAGVPTETGPLHLGCSLGVALLPRDALTMEAAIEHADMALYAAKRHKVPVRGASDHARVE